MTYPDAKRRLGNTINMLLFMDFTIYGAVQENVMRSIIRALLNAPPAHIPALADNCSSNVRVLSTIGASPFDFSGRTRMGARGR